MSIKAIRTHWPLSDEYKTTAFRQITINKTSKREHILFNLTYFMGKVLCLSTTHATYFYALIKPTTLNLFSTVPVILPPVYPLCLFRIPHGGKHPYIQTSAWNRAYMGKIMQLHFFPSFIVSLLWNLSTSSWKIVSRGPVLYDFDYNTFAILVSTRLNAMFRFQIAYNSTTGKMKSCLADKNKEQMGGQIRLLPVSRPDEAIG